MGAVDPGDTNVRAKRTDGFRWVTTPAQAPQRGHAGIVPAIDMTVANQFQQFAFRHHGVGEVEARELGLAGMVVAKSEVFDKPVVQQPMRVELKRAQRVRGSLDRVALPVRPVVGRVDLPFVAGAEVVGVADAVHDRVPHGHVVVGHVDLGSKDLLTVGELP